MRRVWWIAALIGAVCIAASPARADDVADEADLRFELGLERYQRGDFKGALEHFLASNRLVANRNVLFNAARCYEQLGAFPSAFRYYTDARVGETDEAQRGRIEQALARIRSNVAVVEIVSDPPGAKVFIEREDLGQRGRAPLELGYAGGPLELVLVLDGHDTRRVRVEPVRIGERRLVRVALVRITGTLKLGGRERGAEVRVGSESAKPSCALPCRLTLPAGSQRIWVSRADRVSRSYDVEIPARGSISLDPTLAVRSGSLSVTTSEPGASVEVDGRLRGVTPIALALPVGLHTLRVSSEGRRSEVRRIEIDDGKEEAIALDLEPAREVEAASRSVEDVADAPGSVSLVSRHELQAMAYPTVAEALRGVRGVSLSDDRSYTSMGVRGLGRLGSYDNRVVVLIDGHPTNDDWVGSAYLGYDLRADLADVERIEVVRGPGSVLYGTNALTGVVNLVLRRPGNLRRSEVGVSSTHEGVGRMRLRTEAPLGAHASVWSSAGYAHGAGRDLDVDGAGPNGETLRIAGADGFDAGTVAGGARWRFVSVQAHGHVHDKRYPTGAFDTLVGDPDARQRDLRGFLELRADPKLSERVASFSRLHLNRYQFRGGYPRDAADGGLEIDEYIGSWFGAEQRFTIEIVDGVQTTVGGEGQWHAQVRQRARDEAGVFLDESRPFGLGAAYANLDAAIVRGLSVNAGARLDAYSTFGTSLNPRFAVLVSPWVGGRVKLLAGKAFRAPSVYELSYQDGGATQQASPGLRPEALYSAEVELAQRLGRDHELVASVFDTLATDLIVTRGAGVPGDLLRYENSPAPIGTLGAEIELRRELRRGVAWTLSYAFADPRYLRDTSLGTLLSLRESPDFRRVENAPQHQATAYVSVPFAIPNSTASSRLTYAGRRWDRFESVSDPPQLQTQDAVLWDVVLAGRVRRERYGWALGVYNAFDSRWRVPLSTEFRSRTLLQSGRTFLLSADATF